MKALWTLILLAVAFVTAKGADRDTVVVGTGKPVALPSWGNGAPSLTLVLPKGFELKSIKGPDFDVHQMRHPKDIGVLSIYVGHHPDRKSDQSATPIKKKFGSKQVEFEKKKTTFGSFADALIPGFFKGDAGSGVDKLILHVFIHAKDERLYDEIWPMLESVTKSKIKSEPDGAANGNQPFRSKTNSTSSAAGSRR